jgi:hypothetical protein
MEGFGKMRGEKAQKERKWKRWSQKKTGRRIKK